MACSINRASLRLLLHAHSCRITLSSEHWNRISNSNPNFNFGFRKFVRSIQAFLASHLQVQLVCNAEKELLKRSTVKQKVQVRQSSAVDILSCNSAKPSEAKGNSRLEKNNLHRPLFDANNKNMSYARLNCVTVLASNLTWNDSHVLTRTVCLRDESTC